MKLQADTLRQYIEFSRQIKDLEAKREALQGSIMDGLDELNTNTLKTDDGIFTIAKRKTWYFPQHIEEAVEEAKLLKEQYKESGKGKFTEKPYLVFRTK